MIDSFPKKIEDLLGSEQRRSIYHAILNFDEPFTQPQLLEKLKANNVKVSENMFQQFIQALVFRKFLIATKQPLAEKRPGRHPMNYRISPEYRQ